VTTWTGTDLRSRTRRELGDRAAQVAGALRDLGVGPFDRVATFMWNNNEHLEVYTAVPAMGAVLHALDIRLFPEQMTYVANHAEDKVVFVDGFLLASFAPLLPGLRTVRHVVVVNGDAGPVIDERSAAAMCRKG
jgi:fatty-acyl-CoA synthase